MLRYALPLFLLLANACQVSNTSGSTPEQQQASAAQVNQIIFLDLDIAVDTVTKETTVRLLNKMVTDGKLKNAVHPEEMPKPGDLQYSLLSASGQTLFSKTIPDPLVNTLEYASESGSIQQKTFHLKKAGFTIRAPFYPGTTHLLIEQVQQDNKLKEISKLAL